MSVLGGLITGDSAARALGLLLDTWEEEDLPDLPLLPADATSTP